MFGILLLPAWWKPLRPYIFCENIIRGIRYGPNQRNFLDVYLPAPSKKSQSSDPQTHKSPVAVLVWGGAWIIGYKAWPFILAQELARNGVLCVSIDYRNFPQGNVVDMVEDVNNAMNWVFENIECLGGDPDCITLIGQSAGAHLTTLSLLHQASDKTDYGVWDCSRLKHYVGISGAYDLVALKPILDKHGLEESLFREVMNQDLISNSPLFYVRSNHRTIDTSKLPPITLIHGTGDKTITSAFTRVFAEELIQYDVMVDTHIFPGKSHTDFFLEDPIEGIGEPFFQYLYSIIFQTPYKKLSDGKHRLTQEGYAPRFLVNLARLANPF
jgi:prenylcysteine alpha-carboxyl methylesterase